METTMEEKRTGKYVYIKRSRKGLNFRMHQKTLILIIFSIIALISLWLPAYFASLPLSGS